MIALALKFEEPSDQIPAERSVRAALAAELRDHPGEWLLLGTWKNPGSARQIAYVIRQGGSGWQMFGAGYEVESNTVIGENRIYVRYAGGAS